MEAYFVPNSKRCSSVGLLIADTRNQ